MALEPGGRVLAVAGVFPPAGGAGALRLCKLFKHLRAFGWEVDVVAPRDGHGWFADPSLDAEAEGLTVLRAGPPRRQWLEGTRRRAKDPRRRAGLLRAVLGPLKRARDLLAFPDERVGWIPFAARRAWQALRERRYDLLFTSSLPYSAHLVGLWLRRHVDLPWFVELRDPWAGHVYRGRGGGLAMRLDQALERRVLERAHAVSVISPAMRRLLEARYGAALSHKLGVLPNGFDPGDFAAPVVRRKSEFFELAYTGSLDGILEPPGLLLPALVQLSQRRPSLFARLRLNIYGGADLRSSAELSRFMERHEGTVVMHGFVSHLRAVEAMRQADALLLLQAPGAHVYTSKVFEYLASGRPILAIVGDGDCRALLDECGGAAVVDPGDTEALVSLLGETLAAGALRSAPPRVPQRVERYALPTLASELAERFARLRSVT